MRSSNFNVAVLGFTLLLLAAPQFAQAQAQPGGQGRQRGQGNQGQRGNFDPAQARERAVVRVKEQLAASDEEWKVLQPKVEKLLTAQQDARTGRGGAQGGRGNRGQRGQGGQAAQPQAPATPAANQSEVVKAAEELRVTLADKSASPEDIARKLAALHEAKEKAKVERAAAEKELKELLTARQEAILVSTGLIS
jgi:hypothetical protein